MSDSAHRDYRRGPIEVRFRGGGFAPRTYRWVGALVFIVLIALVRMGNAVGLDLGADPAAPSDVLPHLRGTLGERPVCSSTWRRR